jgi:transcriptional regulator with XRE-family HTH domain
MEPYEELDRALNECRLDRGMEWSEVAAAIGMSPRSLLDIRKGRSEPRPLNARKMDDFLQWPPGSVDALLAGRGLPEPRRVEPGGRTTAQNIAESNVILDEIQRRLRAASDHERKLILELLRSMKAKEE